jgi:hypothetical protein
VGEAKALAPVLEGELPEAIEPEGRIELVTDGGLAAVISEVPIAEYGQEELQERLADPAWTALRAMRHENVVGHFAARADLVPLRFGGIYLRRDRIKRMLSERRAELLEVIERLRGKEEWGVNIFRDAAKLAEKIVEADPALREMARRADSASPGESYLLKKKIDALKAGAAGAEARRVIAAIERDLETASDGAARLRVSKGETTDRGELAAKFAFLIARARFPGFVEAAERLAAEHAPMGFQLELVGPWPAYNFTAAKS